MASYTAVEYNADRRERLSIADFAPYLVKLIARVLPCFSEAAEKTSRVMRCRYNQICFLEQIVYKV